MRKNVILGWFRMNPSFTKQQLFSVDKTLKEPLDARLCIATKRESANFIKSKIV